MGAPWFRTTDLTRWGGANSGGDLSAGQFDDNTWYFYSNIQTLLSRPILHNIAYATVTGNQLTFTMTDHSQIGPVTIPTSAFNWRGAWQPNTAYLVNDVITTNGQVYIVTWNHTSAATFSAGANDGAGHNYYALMLSAPGNALPTGGATGQALVKSSNADFATTWGWPLPLGGTTNQVLMKNSNTNQDVSWKTSPWVWVPPASPAGGAGMILATVDGTPTNMEWLGIATSAQYQADTAGLVLTTDMVWGAAEFGALTDAATIAVDMSKFINAGVILAGNRILGNPTNAKAGQTGVISITQDATGARLLTYASNWKFSGGTAPTLTATANAVDLLFYQVLSATQIYAHLVTDVR